MDISVIIVNYRGWNALSDCLDSLQKIVNQDFSFEVVVVDNASNDGKLAGFKLKYPDFIFVENSGNNGFANGCNRGAEIAKGNYFLFLNPDTTVTGDALKTLMNTYQNHPEVALLSCLQIDEKGRYYNQKLLFPSFGRFFGSFRAVWRLFHRSYLKRRFSSENTIFYPDWISGAVVFISRKWFQNISGWNEDYWLYFEDVDLSKKVSNQNGKVAVTKAATIFHQHGGASRINIQTKSLTKTEVIISKHVYIHNHFFGIKRAVLHFLLIVGILIEKGLLSLLSLLLFFNRKLKVNRLIFSKLCTYYWNALKKNTWISPRSVNYPIK